MVDFLEVCSGSVLEEVSIFKRLPIFLGSKRIPAFSIENNFFFFIHIFGFGFWFLVFGFWFLVFGFWFLAFGFWFLVFGFWFLVFSF